MSQYISLEGCPFTDAKKDTGTPEADRPPIMAGDSKLRGASPSGMQSVLYLAFVRKQMSQTIALPQYRRKVMVHRN